MSNLKYPDAASLAESIRRGEPGASAPDALSQWDLTGDVLTGRLAAGETTVDLVITLSGDTVADVVIQPTTSGPDRWDERVMARFNALLNGTGVRTQTQWRTKTTALRLADFKVLPLGWGETLSIHPDPVTGQWIEGSSSASIPAAGAPVGALVAAAPAVPAAAPTAALTGGTVAPTTTDLAPTVGEPVDATRYATVDAFVPEDFRLRWQAQRAAHRAGEPALVGITGPTGQGKTHAVHTLCREEGVPLFVVYAQMYSGDPEMWFGQTHAGPGGTFFRPSDFLQAMMPGKGPVVVLIEELNRASGKALDALLPALDGSGVVHIPALGGNVRLNPEAHVVFTANIGVEYVNVDVLDGAMHNRVEDWIEVEYPDEGIEFDIVQQAYPDLPAVAITDMCRMAAAIRDSALINQSHKAVSTRQVLGFARKVHHGLPIRLAVEALLSQFPKDGVGASPRDKVRGLVAGFTFGEAPMIEDGLATVTVDYLGREPGDPGFDATTARQVTRGTVSA